MIAFVLGAFVVAVTTAIVALFYLYRATRRAVEATVDAERQKAERERSERMAKEMLKETSREDVARDLDSGKF